MIDIHFGCSAPGGVEAELDIHATGNEGAAMAALLVATALVAIASGIGCWVGTIRGKKKLAASKGAI